METYIAELWYRPWRVDGEIAAESGSRADMLALAEGWRLKYSADYTVTVYAAPIMNAICLGTESHRGTE